MLSALTLSPQLNQGSLMQNRQNVEPTSGMHILKHAKWHDGTILGDVVPLAHVRALTSLEHSLEFWLNKYINKETFYALNK